MGKIIAVCNQKGGVGKTTTVINLGVGLVRKGHKVLLVDADPQGSLTVSLGWRENDNIENTLAEMIYQQIEDIETDAHSFVLHHEEGVDIVPANIKLATIEMSLFSAISRERVLGNCLRPLVDEYDYILIDCSPSLGMVTINALTAADSVIIPVQAHFLAALAMSELFKSISKVKKNINPGLMIDGVVLTLVQPNTNMAKSVKESIQESYGAFVRMFDTYIPVGIKAADATAEGVSIYKVAGSSAVAKAYTALTEEVLNLK